MRQPKLTSLPWILALVLAPAPYAFAEEGSRLAKALPREVEGFERSTVQSVSRYDQGFSEISTSFRSKGTELHVFLSDLSERRDLYRSFLEARGLQQVSFIPSAQASLDLYQPSGSSDLPEGSTEQASPTVLVQPSSLGPDELRAIQESVSPGLLLDQGSGVDLHASLGRGILATASPTTGLMLQVPQLSEDGEQVSPTGQILTVSGEKISLESGARIDLLSSQDLQISEVANGSSFIQPYKHLKHDIAGWRVFDATTGSGALILGIADRYALLVEGTGLENLEALDHLVGKIDLREILEGE